MSGSSDKNSPARNGRSHSPIGRWTITALIALLGALVPLMASLGAGLYSTVQKCNQDASDMQTQLTSILLEIEGREQRLRSVLVAEKVPNETLIKELTQIESGAEGYSNDPLFKDHSLVGLVHQYDRLLRRVEFPPELKCPGCGAAGLGIDTRVHAAIETLDVTQLEPHSYAGAIDTDLTKVEVQQAWHKRYGPVHRCSLTTLLVGSEPWHLIRLDQRPDVP